MTRLERNDKAQLEQLENSDIRNFETDDEVSKSMDRTKYEGINKLVDDGEEHDYLCDL